MNGLRDEKKDDYVTVPEGWTKSEVEWEEYVARIRKEVMMPIPVDAIEVDNDGKILAWVNGYRVSVGWIVMSGS